MVRFLVDAQLPPALCDRLREVRFEAQHVQRLGLGAAPDRVVWQRAIASAAVLVTKHIDFVALVGREPSPPAVVWVRLGNTTNAALWASFETALTGILAAIEAGERLIELR